MPQTLDYVSARALLMERVAPVEAQPVQLSFCAGRILAEDLIAAGNIPPFERSPLDGYAFIASDTANASPEHPVTLRVTENIPAGTTPTVTVTPGTAVRLMTGAPVPQGADAVSKYEETSFTAESVTLYRPYRSGENVIRIGEDVKQGTLLASTGQIIDTGIAGTLAAQGVTLPSVFRRLRVGIVSTGSEVVEAEAEPAPGKIRNANRHSLETALLHAGMEPVYLGLAGDDADHIAQLITKGLVSCDAVLSTGGVSVGDYDLTPDAMERAGVEMLFRGVDLKPGMACAYGVKDGKPVCGLSGNPASSLTNFYCIALPALRKMAGHAQPVPQEIMVTLRDGFRKKSRGTRVLRGTLDLSDGTVRMALPKDQGNVVLSSTIGCNVMAIVPAGSGPIEAGTTLKGFVL